MESLTKPLVAYINISLYQDGCVKIKTSDHIKSCASLDEACHLQRQLVKAHQAHVSATLTAKSNADGKNPRCGQWVKRKVPGPDDNDPKTKKELASIPQQMLLTFHHRHSPKNRDSEDSSDSGDNADADVPVVPASVTHSFMIQETEKVTDFIKSRLAHINQISVKRLAKAWIKGICPKKQALFPYHCKKRKKVPMWWPDTKRCPFVEPDHVRKEDRLHLCLHLLRLRPEPGNLREWNDNQWMPEATYDTGGWINFLEDVASPDIVKDPRVTEEINKRRTKYVKEIYDVLRMEEKHRNGDQDGTALFSWVEDSVDTLAESRATTAFQYKRETTEPQEDIETAEANSTASHRSVRASRGAKAEESTVKSTRREVDTGYNSVSNKRRKVTRHSAALPKPDDNDLSTRERTATPVGSDADDDEKGTVSRRLRKPEKRARLDDETCPGIIVPNTSSPPTRTISSPVMLPASVDPPSWLIQGPQQNNIKSDALSFDLYQSSMLGVDTLSAEPCPRPAIIESALSTSMPSLHFDQQPRTTPVYTTSQMSQPFPIAPHQTFPSTPQDYCVPTVYTVQQHPLTTPSWTTSFTGTIYHERNHNSTPAETGDFTDGQIRFGRYVHSSGDIII